MSTCLPSSTPLFLVVPVNLKIQRGESQKVHTNLKASGCVCSVQKVRHPTGLEYLIPPWPLTISQPFVASKNKHMSQRCTDVSKSQT